MIMDETKPPFEPTPAKEKKQRSQINVSVRGIIVLMVVATVCYMAMKALKVEEPLYSLVFITVGYYFGQNQQQKQTHPVAKT